MWTPRTIVLRMLPDGSPQANVRVLGLRGATTFDIDEAAHVGERTVDLLQTMLQRNGLTQDDVISVLFTATPDLHSVFPATAARSIGFGDAPLMCAQELAIDGAKAQCIRILMHIHSTKRRDELHHIYLEGARDLRDDLPE